MARWAMIVVALASCGRFGFAVHTGDGHGGDDDDGANTDGDPPNNGVTHLVAYGDQTCALWDGVPFCWGDNGKDQLGFGPGITGAFIPTQVPLPEGAITDLALGQNHTCAIVAGKLYCFGSLGMGTSTPMPLVNPASAVGAGLDFSCVITNSNVMCWGSSAGAGQLGLGDMNPRTAPTATSMVNATAIALGDDHGCALDGGKAYCWGHNDDGTLGTGSMNPAQSLSPVAVINNSAVLPHIAGWHACDLVGGSVRCWGEGDNGELGDGTMVNRATPGPVPSITAVTAIAVGGAAADKDATCVVASGAVKCWGNGGFGRLGQGMAMGSATPIDVVGLPGAAKAIAVGYAHSCAVVGGDVWCWGRGTSGQLGNGQGTNSLTPVRVTTPSS